MRGTPSHRHQNTAIACGCVVCNVQLASIMSDCGRAKGGYAEPELLVINIEALPHYKKVVESNGHSSHLYAFVLLVFELSTTLRPEGRLEFGREKHAAEISLRER